MAYTWQKHFVDKSHLYCCHVKQSITWACNHSRLNWCRCTVSLHVQVRVSTSINWQTTTMLFYPSFWPSSVIKALKLACLALSGLLRLLLTSEWDHRHTPLCVSTLYSALTSQHPDMWKIPVYVISFTLSWFRAFSTLYAPYTFFGFPKRLLVHAMCWTNNKIHAGFALQH